jgi:fumagillin biosynthesis methyltransferase
MRSNPSHLDFWARCQTDPKLYESFSTHMADWTRVKPDWTDTFDTKTLLKSGTDLTKGPFVVDMGGHHGVDLSRVVAKHPDLPSGALVLQDLPEVIAVTTTKVDASKITTMPHDFFTPQPVRGARAYFMHAVLHDWPDHSCLDIFEKLKPAMERGYSKLLVCDNVVPPRGASIAQTVMDVQMMALLAAKERTQGAWEELLGKAGFGNVRFHHDGRGLECVIEADLL